MNEAGGRRLIERDREQTALDAALCAAARGRGSAVVVERPSGIGITALLETAAQTFAQWADVLMLLVSPALSRLVRQARSSSPTGSGS